MDRYYYKSWRQAGKKPAEAKRLAEKKVMPSKLYRSPEYNPAQNNGCRWVENFEAGLRLAGYADKLSRSIKHSGWYTNVDIPEEVLRGIVIQIPARKRAPVFFAGYEDAWNEGCGLIDFSEPTHCEIEAALMADSMAENAAEKEREYSNGWRAGIDYYELKEELQTTRKELKEAIAAKRAMPELPEKAHSIVCEKVADLWQNTRVLIEKRIEIKNAAEAAYNQEFKAGFFEGARG